MIENPNVLVASRQGAKKFKKLQWLVNKKTSRRKENENAAQGPFALLPTEILLQIFGFLRPAEVSAVCRTCRRFSAVCSTFRAELARVPVWTLAVRYGQWRDVLKHRKLDNKDDNSAVTYRVSNGIRTPTKRPYRPAFLFGRQPARPPFCSVLRNCSFETTLVIVEMLNGEIGSALRLDELDSQYVYLDFSHHSLHFLPIQRYLPALAAALNSNRHVQSVDFIFQSMEDAQEAALERIVASEMPKKRVSVIFVGASRNLR